MTGPRVRARSARDKQERAEALLRAATELGLEDGVRAVTLTAVTTRVGLHPSALRRYFESNDELLLVLAERGWAEWRTGLAADLADDHELAADDLGARISDSLDRLPLFCDLLTHVALSLEGSVRLERARSYKLAATEAFDAMTDAVTAAGADLDGEGAYTILSVAMSCAAYLYQLSRPTPTLAQLYAEEPRWAHSALRFRQQLARQITSVTLGEQVRVQRSSTTG